MPIGHIAPERGRYLFGTMKKTCPTGKKIAGSGDSRAVHLRKAGKRRANKGTRKALRSEAAAWF